jgi:hypothetical protein
MSVGKVRRMHQLTPSDNHCTCINAEMHPISTSSYSFCHHHQPIVYSGDCTTSIPTTHSTMNSAATALTVGLCFARLQDVLLYYGAQKYGSGPPALGCRSPRSSYDPEAHDFLRERGSYQNVFEHP